MFDKMKQLMEMKKQADQLKRQMDAMIIESEEVKGIKMVLNGSMQFKKIEIDESLLVPGNKQKLEQDILRSINAGVNKAQKQAASKMSGMLPGF